MGKSMRGKEMGEEEAEEGGGEREKFRTSL